MQVIRGTPRWLRARGLAAFNKWVEGLILLAAGVLALLIWRLLRPHVRSDVRVPAWILALIAASIACAVLIQALRLRRRRGEIEELEGGVEEIASIAAETEQRRAMTAGYAEHLIEILYALQRVLSGAIPDVTVSELIENGILQPCRDLVKTRQDEDVRLSVLVPDNGDFIMPFAAGHNLESKRNFRLAIDLSFSKWAYQTGLIYWSSDLDNDDRFVRHPRAAQERDYNSIISVPIRLSDNVVAVFNAIFTPTDAFDQADLLYVRLIGAVIELVWQLTDGPLPIGGAGP
jgi:GAF domain-containing protein